MPTPTSEIVEISLLTLQVSGTALMIAAVLGLGMGFAIALKEFPGKKVVITLLNTAMGLPPVVVGLAVLMLFWRQGPLGFLEWIYTPKAMIVAQIILATPIIAGLTLAAIQQIPLKLKWQAQTLGAKGWNLIRLFAHETRFSLFAALMAGFGGIISEVGAVMMVGGNIKGQTRVLTTAIVLESQKGELGFALALGGILLTLSFSINLFFTWLQQKRIP
jgi:tungstate transport system permease protein